MPLPEHISARPDDLPALVEGMFAFERGPAEQIDAVVAAAILAFGFVYAHPFEDGNGRVHRYLIHHILSKRGFNPPELMQQLLEKEGIKVKDNTITDFNILFWDPFNELL